MTVTSDYPNLYVRDERMSGAVTIGESRLPLRTITNAAISVDWAYLEDSWSPTERYGFTESDLRDFLRHLLDHRRSFARLLCVLADVERREYEHDDEGDEDWYRWQDDPEQRDRVLAALRACIDELEASK